MQKPSILFACVLLLGVFGSKRLLAQDPEAFQVGQVDQKPQRWTQSTYLDFADGTLVDGGANDYVSSDGSIRLINGWDLNLDGNIDIVLPSEHDNNAAVSSYIYWGETRFDVRTRVELPGDGARSGTVADVNGDGIPDIVIANGFNGTKTELHSFVYWGTHGGYSADDRLELPTVDATAVAAGDLNRDGYADLVFASGGYSYQFNRAGGDTTFLRPYSDIYWGSAAGFSSRNTSQLPTFDATDVKITDLNHDGYPDIQFAMRGELGKNSGVFIYWGAKLGQYTASNRSLLPGLGTTAVSVADLDADGAPEVILANGGRIDKAAALRVEYPIPSYIYWGKEYSVVNRTELPAQGASDVKVGDLNGDGFLDIVFANKAGEASFIYWGNFGAHGGYSSHRRTALPTFRASHCAIYDLNNDRLPDLIFSNEDNGKTRNINSFIYWNSRNGFDATHRLEIPTQGATDVQVAKLGSDGRVGLLFVNSGDGTAGQPTDTYIYWGNPNGLYSPSSRLTLPISRASSYTAADLNTDGYPDLIFSARGGVRILWGAQAGFSLENVTLLPMNRPWNVSVADFNRDGYLDLSVSDSKEPAAQDQIEIYWGGPQGFSSANKWMAPFPGIRCNGVADLDANGYLDILVTGIAEKAVIFWNGPGGFDRNRTTILPTKEVITSQVADLNADGYLDIIIPNLYDYQKLLYPKGASDIAARPQGAPFEAGTYIYWGSASGYSTHNRQVLPTIGAEGAASADINQDGFLDLAISSYHAGDVRNHPSYVFWGSAKGFDSTKVTLLPTDSASLVEIADFNKDGWKDILFANHTDGANHRTNSYVYWGAAEGLSASKKLLLPSIGVHGLMLPEVGNIKDRTDGFDYISPPFCSEEKVQFQKIGWQLKTSVNPGAKFQVRYAPMRKGLEDAAWQGPEGQGTYYEESPGILNSPGAVHCIQYKTTLIGYGGTNSPVLQSVIVDYTETVR